MESGEIFDIVKLRLAVGLLGEHNDGNWWPSKWWTSNATAFLTPIYGARSTVAQYHGVIESARRVHDERIGVGRVFHLFRLPETLEQRIHDAVLGRDEFDSIVGECSTTDAARNVLDALGSQSIEISPGPVRVGGIDDLMTGTWTSRAAVYYRAAFISSRQCFPYFADHR